MSTNTTENEYKSKSVRSILKSDAETKHVLKQNLSYKSIFITALFFSLIFIICLGLCIQTEVNYLNTILSDHVNMLDKSDLTHSLKVAQAPGVTIGAQGLVFEDDSKLTPEQIKVNAEKGEDVFKKANFKAALNIGNEPTIYGIKVNEIMMVYFFFFIVFALFPLTFFVIWKLLSEWNIRKNKQLSMGEYDYPKLVTVIVPAYNEENSIGRCIESLLNQDYKGALEIIIVNDGSKDGTAEIVSKYPVKFINLTQNVGKANALNMGMEDATGDIIVFSDGDSSMEKSAISSIIKCFHNNQDTHIVTGTVLINRPEKMNILTYCQMIEYHLEQEIARHLQALNGKVLVCPGPITAAKREVCETVKYSDDTIVEDADFTVNALRQSMKVVRDPYAKVFTNAPQSWKVWIKQRKRWWYGNLQVWRMHKKWTRRNPWMVYNYTSYITSICSIVMILFMPYLILQYHNSLTVALHGVLYLIIPIFIYMIITAPFFKHDKSLIVMLIPYMTIYSILKIGILSYLYICYLTGRGLDIKFGSRKIRVK
jgi:cellulose synthase/poly-beta-1,6-N-acetylglucosamine synthase-like glycosyltransferase